MIDCIINLKTSTRNDNDTRTGTGTTILGKIVTVVILGTIIIVVATTIVTMVIHHRATNGIMIVFVTVVGAEAEAAVLPREIVEGKLVIETWVKLEGTKYIKMIKVAPPYSSSDHFETFQKA
jgi:hypothetical protein